MGGDSDDQTPDVLREVGREVLGDEPAHGEPHHVSRATDAFLECYSVIGRHLAVV